jgi:hypothetical protein
MQSKALDAVYGVQISSLPDDFETSTVENNDVAD